MERWGFMLLVATIAGTVYFLPDCFVDRYFTSGQLWVCGIAGAWGIFALWRAKRCSYLGMAVGGVLLVAWGYDQLQQILDYNRDAANLDWGVYNNCTDYSISVWNLISDEKIPIDEFGSIVTPKALSDYINNKK